MLPPTPHPPPTDCEWKPERYQLDPRAFGQSMATRFNKFKRRILTTVDHTSLIGEDERGMTKKRCMDGRERERDTFPMLHHVKKPLLYHFYQRIFRGHFWSFFLKSPGTRRDIRVILQASRWLTAHLASRNRLTSLWWLTEHLEKWINQIFFSNALIHADRKLTGGCKSLSTRFSLLRLSFASSLSQSCPRVACV